MHTITVKQLHKAIRVRQRIETLERKLDEILGWEVSPMPAQAKRKGRRRMPASARAKLAAIAKARWKAAKAKGKSRL